MDIAEQATEYYGGLFAPTTQDGSQETGYGMDLDDLLRAQWVIWE